MNDAFVARASEAIDSMDIGHFSTHGLGEMLAEMGEAHDLATVRALIERLIEDEAYGQVDAIAAGLREMASDDDGLAQIVDVVAKMARCGMAEGPVSDALVYAGRTNPSTAALAAERLAGIGDAGYAAFLVGGAYAGATARCEGLIGSLASSGNAASVAAALASVRFAYTEHGAPDAGRIADMVSDALRIDDDGVRCEAMEALLDIHDADKERTGPMIRDLAARCRACRPILATCISLDFPFSDDECLDYLDMCIEDVSISDRGVVHGAYRALRRLATSRPDRATRMLVRLAERGAHIGTHAGPVIAELGRKSPEAAAAAILSLLRRAPKGDMVESLPLMVRQAAKFSDPATTSEAVAAALRSDPEVSRHYLPLLAAHQ